MPDAPPEGLEEVDDELLLIIVSTELCTGYRILTKKYYLSAVVLQPAQRSSREESIAAQTQTPPTSSSRPSTQYAYCFPTLSSALQISHLLNRTLEEPGRVLDENIPIQSPIGFA